MSPPPPRPPTLALLKRFLLSINSKKAFSISRLIRGLDHVIEGSNNEKKEKNFLPYRSTLMNVFLFGISASA